MARNSPIEDKVRNSDKANPNLCQPMKSIFGVRLMTIRGLISLQDGMSGWHDGQIGIARGFHSRSQVTIKSRVTRIAENSDVNTPMLSVTAKPLTGPEPSQNISAPATRVVTWLSRIVPKARLNPASSAD